MVIRQLGNFESPRFNDLIFNYQITKFPNYQILMAWFKRESGDLDNSGKKTVRTEGLWVKCESCRQIIWKKIWKRI